MAGDSAAPSACTEQHGYECCGCAEHPVGKPWGWNHQAWNEHLTEVDHA